MSTPKQIKPWTVRYIKLGDGGRWEKSCFAKGTVRLGFDTGRLDIHAHCVAGHWEQVAEHWRGIGKNAGTVTRFTNEMRSFFEDRGDTLWITLSGGSLYWGFGDSSDPAPEADGESSSRPIVGGWRNTDIDGLPLTMDRLSGVVTKLQGFRGTSCNVDCVDYVVRRINGKRIPEVSAVEQARDALLEKLVELVRLLQWYDFETLVELVFSTSGWRRMGKTGGTQKTVDLELELPSTGDRAFVQVKSATTQSEFNDYVAELEAGTGYERMFYVYHSGVVTSTTSDVTLIGPERLAAMLLEAGLVRWVIEKTM